MTDWHGWQHEDTALWLAVDPAAARPEDSLVLVHMDGQGTVRRLAVFDDPACAATFQTWMDGSLAATGELNAALAAMQS